MKTQLTREIAAKITELARNIEIPESEYIGDILLEIKARAGYKKNSLDLGSRSVNRCIWTFFSYTRDDYWHLEINEENLNVLCSDLAGLGYIVNKTDNKIEISW